MLLTPKESIFKYGNILHRRREERTQRKLLARLTTSWIISDLSSSFPVALMWRLPKNDLYEYICPAMRLLFWDPHRREDE